MNQLRDILNQIDKSNKIALYTHFNCDCDGVGSMLALYNFLIDRGKSCDMFVDGEIPTKFQFLKNVDKINMVNKDFTQSKINLNSYDLLISLDTSNLTRLGIFEEDFKNFKNTVNIDHHVSNSLYGKYNYIKAYSSCGEVLFEVMKEMSKKLSPEVATCLFAAISSDTNRFSNPNITSKTFIFAGELVNFGADHNLVNLCLFKNKSKEELNIISFMTKKIKFYKDISYVYIRLKDLKKFNVKSSDVSNYMYLISNIENSKINILIKERGNGEYRFSLRSINGFDVNKIANKFGGGGHINASACSVHGKLKKVLKKVLIECEEEIYKKVNKL